ncbi:sugar-binding protein [Bacteroidota bacterium]
MVDGVIDEFWSSVEVHDINKPFVHDYLEPTLDLATWQMVWNDTSIFILVVVNDDEHCDQWCSGDVAWRSEGIEIWFDVNEDLEDGQGPGQFPNGHYQIAWDEFAFQQGIDEYYWEGYLWRSPYFRSAYILNSANYVYEVEVSIADLVDSDSIPMDPNTVDEIGFDVYVVDRDLEDIDRKRAVWINDGDGPNKDENWNNMDDAGRIIFSKYDPTLFVSTGEGKVENNSSINIGYTNVGETIQQKINLKNIGELDIDLTSVSVSGSGFNVNAIVDSTIDFFEDQEITISFTQTDEGVFDGTLVIESNDADNSTYTINLSAGTYFNISEGKAEITKLPDGTAPVIDGTIDALWENIGVRTIEKQVIFNYDDATIDLATWRATWNDTALFVLIEVIDDDHCDQWCSGANPWESDRVEVYLDVNDELDDELGPDETGSGHYQFPGEFKQDTLITTDTNTWPTIHFIAYALNGTNYIFEYEIPIDSLYDKNGNSLSPVDIDEIGFEVGIIDRDSYDWDRRKLYWVNDESGDTKSNAEIITQAGLEFPLLARFKKGIEYYEGAGDAPAGPRTYFGMGYEYFDPPVVEFFPIVEPAKTVYLTEIKRMLGNANDILFITPDNRDDENIAFLRANGYDVSIFWPSETLGSEPQSTIDLLNDAGLIIIGRSCPTINFEQEIDKDAWNNLTAPLMSVSQWAVRSNRLNWFNTLEVHHWTTEGTDSMGAEILNWDDAVFDSLNYDDYGDWINWSTFPNDLLYMPLGQDTWFNMDDCGTVSFIQTEPLISVLSEGEVIYNDAEINFGSINADSIKEFTISLINRGKNDLTISALTIPEAGYSVTTPADLVLSKNETKEVTVSFTSSDLGIHDGILEITSDDLLNPTYTINFTIGTSITLENGEAVFKKLPTGTAPSIDGEIDALWNNVGVYSLDKNFQSDVPTLDLATWQATWNDTAIFVLVRVEDDIHCDEWCAGDVNWMADKPEIYFDVNDRLKDGQGPDVENGHYQFAPGFVQDVDTFIAIDTPDWRGYVHSYAYTIDGDNYVFEYMIPINTLVDKEGDTLDPVLIDEIGFDVGVIDRDSPEEERNIAVWSNTEDFDWYNMDPAGIAVFTQYEPALSVVSKRGGISNNGTFSLGHTDANVQKDVTLTLRNIGEQQLSITGMSTTGTGFSVNGPDTVLNLFETCKITVSYTGTTDGVYTGTLQITSNDATNSTYTINLRIGVGLTVVEGGMISGTWTKDESPYHIEGNIIIPDDSTLKIEDSVEVIFQGPYYFHIDGQLLAMGTETDSILFTRNDTAGFYIEDALDGGWQGFIINNEGQMDDNDSTIFKYCIIEYAKAYDAHIKEMHGAAIYNYGFSDVLINHCLIKDNYTYYDGGAIYASQFADIDIYNSTITNNRSRYGQGGALCILQGSKPTIYNNTISYNTTGYNAAIFAGSGTLCEIYNNIITNNVSQYSTPGGIYLELSNSIIVNNIISNNESAEYGAACVINNCIPTFNNNNICYNRSLEEGTGGIVLWGISPVNFINNIFWGNIGSNGDSTQFDLGSAQPNFYNCLVQDGLDSSLYNTFTGDSVDIFTDKPEFIVAPDSAGSDCDVTDANWNVSTSSVIINRGKEIINSDIIFDKDLYQNDRVIHSYIDIGAVESHIPLMTYSGDTIFYDTYWIADTVKVENEIFVTDSATLKIAPGTVVEFQGYYKFKMRGVLLSQGLSDAMIKFTINDPTGFDDIQSNSGAWFGITLNDDYWDGADFEMQNNDSTIIEYTIIEYAKNMTEDWSRTEGGGIQIEYVSKVRVSNCIIRNNIAAVGAGICIQGFANPVIKNNQFYNNLARSSGGAIEIKVSSNPLILNNLITNNSTQWQGAGILQVYGSKPSIINNVISNNSTTAVILENSLPDFSNNTIVNNAGDGIYLYDCNPELYNTILWGNEWSELWGENSYPELHNSIVDGGLDRIGPWEKRDDYTIENLIKRYPRFIEPTDGPGTNYDGLDADWSVTDLSPIINNGMNLTDIDIPSIDYLGNERIHEGTIDVGAIENQGDPVTILSQPIPQKVCDGDSVTLSFRIKGNATYQWKKNDVNIPLATNKTLTIDPIDIDNEGNYTCVVTNGYGSVETNTAFITVLTPPYILVQPKFSEVCEGDSALLELSATGAAPITYQWYKNNLYHANATSSQYKIETTNIGSSGVYHCIVTNDCGDSYSDPTPLIVHELPMVNLGEDDTICWNEELVLDPGEFELYKWNDYSTERYKLVEDTGLYSVKVTDMFGCVNSPDTIHISMKKEYTPEIFLVTVDTTEGTEGKNLIVWGKPDTDDILSFKIYKETTSAGDYKEIGERAYYNDSNIFVDKNSSPEVKADRYKISIVDVCGETEMSKHHKTIHLSQNERAGAQGVNLQWSHYEGFEFGTYYIYKYTIDTTILLDSIQSTLDSYTDTIPQVDPVVRYQIAVSRDSSIELDDNKKASAGPYAHTTSNMEDNRLRSSEPTDIQLSVNVIYEGLPTGQSIGVLSTMDEDSIDVHSYSIISGGDYFDISDNILISADIFDYEATQQYTIRIQVTDVNGATYEEDFTIQILDNPLDINATPSGIQISSNRIEEGLSAGSQVGILITTDDDATHTYTIVSGGNNFEISENALLTKVVFDYDDQSEYTVRIRTTDPSGESHEEDITIFIKSTTGIEMNSLAEQLLVYPNPVKDILYIKHDLNNINEYSISIINSVGNVVYFNTYFENEITINTNGLAKGLYIVQFNSEEQTVYTRISIIK